MSHQRCCQVLYCQVMLIQTVKRHYQVIYACYFDFTITSCLVKVCHGCKLSQNSTQSQVTNMWRLSLLTDVKILLNVVMSINIHYLCQVITFNRWLHHVKASIMGFVTGTFIFSPKRMLNNGLLILLNNLCLQTNAYYNFSMKSIYLWQHYNFIYELWVV